MSKKLTVIEHPIIEHKLGFLRDKKTDSSEFRRIITELTRIIAYEATKDLSLKEVQLETPISKISLL